MSVGGTPAIRNRVTELRFLARDHKVTRHRQVAPAGETVAVDGGDYWRVALPDGVDVIGRSVEFVEKVIDRRNGVFLLPSPPLG